MGAFNSSARTSSSSPTFNSNQFLFLEYTVQQLQSYNVPFDYRTNDASTIRAMFDGMGMYKPIINYILGRVGTNSEITLRNINPNDFPFLNRVRGPAEYFMLKRGSNFKFFAIAPSTQPFITLI